MNLKSKYEQMFSESVKETLAQIGGFACSRGINTYLVGGIVRDLILCRRIFDIDIVVEGNAISFCKELTTQVKGTISEIQENLKTAKVTFDFGLEIDFSSTRKELYKAPGQLPVLSEFGCSLSEDVKRRDFTVNTLYMQLKKENDFELIDFLNGYKDLKNGQLRILHDKSFIDDPSRLVRLLKFSVRFGFTPEKHTKELMELYLKEPNYSIPFERIKNEFKQLFSLNTQNAFDIAVKTEIYKLVSDKEPVCFSQDRLNCCINKEFVSKNFSWVIPFACLCVNSADSADRLNLTVQERKCLLDFYKLIKNKPQKKLNNSEIYERYSKISHEAIVCEFVSNGSEFAQKYLETIKNIHILINGDDLISLGLEPSEKFKQIFDEVLKQKLKNKLKTREEELEFVKKLI